MLVLNIKGMLFNIILLDNNKSMRAGDAAASGYELS
jgi:hypothetical protein